MITGSQPFANVQMETEKLAVVMGLSSPGSVLHQHLKDIS